MNMNLYLLPSIPGIKDGYQKAVKNDLEYFKPEKDDTIIIFDDKIWTENNGFENVFYISRETHKKHHIVKNVLRFKPISELSAKEIINYDLNDSFQGIVCDEVIFYRSVREIFPQKDLIIRFHNFYSSVYERAKHLKCNLGLKLEYNMEAFSKLEKEILLDKNCFSYFITQDDYEDAKKMYNCKNIGILPMASTKELNSNQRSKNVGKRLIIYGSVMATHTKIGVDYFIKNVYLKNDMQKYYQLFIIGAGTEIYCDKDKNIFGLGFYKGDNLPFDGNGLFLVPDLLGLGIKTKIADLVLQSAYVLATKEAIKGYNIEKCNNVFVSDIDNWYEKILSITV